MKFSAALATVSAPLALAKAVHNVGPVRRDDGVVTPRMKHSNKGTAGGPGAAAALGALDVAGMEDVEIILVWANAGDGAPTMTMNPRQTVTVTKTVTEVGAMNSVYMTTVAAEAVQTHSVSWPD